MKCLERCGEQSSRGVVYILKRALIWRLYTKLRRAFQQRHKRVVYSNTLCPFIHLQFDKYSSKTTNYDYVQNSFYSNFWRKPTATIVAGIEKCECIFTIYWLTHDAIASQYITFKRWVTRSSRGDYLRDCCCGQLRTILFVFFRRILFVLYQGFRAHFYRSRSGPRSRERPTMREKKVRLEPGTLSRAVKVAVCARVARTFEKCVCELDLRMIRLFNC